MDFFDENGNNIGEGKAVFDEDGNLIGHFLKSTKEGVSDAFGISWVWGIIFLLIIAPGWTLLGLLLFLLVKLVKFIFWLIANIIKFVLRCIWWLLRLPFYLIFYRDVPEF